MWSYDFVRDRTSEGRVLRLLTLIDEYSRECLSIDVARSLTSEDVLERLTMLFITRGVPDYIRSDNGSEFTANTVRDWLNRVDVKTLYASHFNRSLVEIVASADALDELRIDA